VKGRWPLVLSALGLVVALVLRHSVFGLVSVQTGSMEPAVEEGSTLLFSRLATPKLGDIVVVQLPDDPEVLHVKRMVAHGPGEIELVDGRLYVDSERVAGEDRLLVWTDANCQTKQVQGIEERGAVVEKGGSHPRMSLHSDEAFLLGDRRAVSEDSRQWGPVRDELVVGVVRGVAWNPPSCDP
jgi:signal peptidase I